MNDTERLANLLKACHPAVLIITHEEDEALSIVRAAIDSGGSRPALMWTATRGVFSGTFENEEGVKDTENAAAGLYHLARSVTSDLVSVVLDVIDHLSDPRTMRAFRELIDRARDVQSTVVFIDHSASPPPVVRAETTQFDLSLPGADEIERLVTERLRSHHQEKHVHVKLRKSHMKTIVRNLSGLTRRQCAQIITDTVAVDRVLDEQDMNHMLAEKRRLLHRESLLDYVEAPVDLSEVGGLRTLKKWLSARERSFDPDAQAFGLIPPRGVLMLGVQGAGKSLCAKAIATAWRRPLLRLDPGALYDRYVGESEKRLRQALETAEMMAPIVLWIDEIEKGFASAASHSTDGGLSQRMFGTLLTWMQEHRSQVFLAATANNIDSLPPELLRKGRFDEIFFVDLPDEKTREMIFAIHLRKRGRDAAQFNLPALAACSNGYSGSEIEQAVVSALHEAFASERELTTDLIAGAVRGSPPLSITMAERIAALRAWSRNRCVPAD